MPISRVNYFFGRLNLIAYYENKFEFLMNSMTKDIEISKRDFDWGFFNVSQIEMENINFITGYVVKYLPLKGEEIVDKELRKLSTIAVPNRAVAASQFFLHAKSGIIAYHPIPGKIRVIQFRDIFSELIMAANGYMLVNAEVQSVDEDIRILEAIRKFDKIYSLQIELHPSNPSNRERWKATDQKIKKLEAEKYRQSFFSKQGLQINEENEVYGDILMAGDGYGKAELRGEKDGKELSASTERIPMRARGKKDVETRDILGSIFINFQNIWNRMID